MIALDVAYMQEIRGEGLLTATQERALGAAVAGADPEARARLIRANLLLVVSIGQGFRGRGLGLEDLVSEGNFGLIRAVEGYDPVFNTRFSTYASYWIKQAMQRALLNTVGPIRVPIHTGKLMARWLLVEQGLRESLGRRPDFTEVARTMRLTPDQAERVAYALTSRRADPGGPGHRTEDLTCGGPTAEARSEAADDRRDLTARLARLSPRESAVITRRFGLGGVAPETLREVGTRYGISREWVRRIEATAIAKLGDTPAAARGAWRPVDEEADAEAEPRGAVPRRPDGDDDPDDGDDDPDDFGEDAEEGGDVEDPGVPGPGGDDEQEGDEDGGLSERVKTIRLRRIGVPQ